MIRKKIHITPSRILTCLSLFLCTLTGAGGMALAATITTDLGNGADAYVRSSLGGNNAANTNYGSSGSVLVKHDTGLPGNNRKGYLRFDLGSVSEPIGDARLELAYAERSGDPFAEPSTYNVFGLIDGHAGENWDEFGITWNNAPGNNIGSAGGLLAGETTLLGSFDLSLSGVSIGDAVSFSSSVFVDFLQSDTNDLITLIITRQQRNFSVEGFASKENLSLAAPFLELTPVPIPPTVLLFGSGLLSLMAFVRRYRK